MSYTDRSLDRRRFLVTTGSIPALSALALAEGRSVALAVDPKDPVASAGPPRWALREFESALTSKGVQVSHCDRPEQAKGDICVVAAGREGRRLGRVLAEFSGPRSGRSGSSRICAIPSGFDAGAVGVRAR
jgi:hypothetical protein